MNLTKSDFKTARTCPTKLFYKKLRYPSLDEENPYREFLADGGYMVETMARLLFPTGREVKSWEVPEQAFEDTQHALQARKVVLFEPTIVHKGLLARVDILRRDGDTLRLIEVKSSAVHTERDGPNPFRGKRGGIVSDWRPYLEDVTFQTVVLERALPQFRVVPMLCVVDKARLATAHSTFDTFQLRAELGAWRPSVDYTGDLEHLQNEHVLALLDVSHEVAELSPDVERAMDDFAATLRSEPIRRIPPELGVKCKNCEFRFPPGRDGKNGFRECWGALADPEPHLLDLYRVDLIGGRNRDVVAELVAEGRSRLADVPRDLLIGSTGARQALQLECTATGQEHLAPALRDLLAKHSYPLHFIDFEGSRLAIPYHEGMRPYEQAAFQWSCHTIRAPGVEIEHADWLNTQEAFPNFEFARTLREQIGHEGTVYIWSTYEVVVLREIREQMRQYDHRDADLAVWIDELTAAGGLRVVDLCKLARDYYVHPAMKGSVSIKYVLPAVWETNEQLRRHPLLLRYVGYDNAGALLNPYATLPPLPIGQEEEVVREGTGAMRVYQEMMYGRAKGDKIARESHRQLLRQYCELDTAAMVAIWMHWRGQTQAPNS